MAQSCPTRPKKFRDGRGEKIRDDKSAHIFGKEGYFGCVHILQNKPKMNFSVDFSIETTISFNFTAEHAKNAEASENSAMIKQS